MPQYNVVWFNGTRRSQSRSQITICGCRRISRTAVNETTATTCYKSLICFIAPSTVSTHFSCSPLTSSPLHVLSLSLSSSLSRYCPLLHPAHSIYPFFALNTLFMTPLTNPTTVNVPPTRAHMDVTNSYQCFPFFFITTAMGDRS